MKLRNKKMLSLLLATAMVFTMNTSVFALEVGDDAGEEYTVDFVDDGAAEETDGAAEVDSVETDDFAFVDEIDGALDIEGYTDATATSTSLNALGWTVDATEAVQKGTKVAGTKVKPLKDQAMTLTGTIESTSLTIDGMEFTENDKLGIKVNMPDKETEDKTTGSSITVTVLSANMAIDIKDGKGKKSGYSYLKGYIGDDEKSLETWAAGLAGKDVVKVEVDASNISKDVTKAGMDDATAKGQIVLKFSFDDEAAEDNNQPYGIATTKAGTATVTYYKNIPFCGKGAIKTNIANAFGMSVSAGSTKYTISKITIKFTKGSNVATIKSVKLTGGDKKAAKAIAKGMKGLTMKCYPYNLDKGASNKKVNKNGTKLTVKINGRKVTVKNGKADGYGGTSVKLTVNGGKVTVSNSNALRGTI